MMSTLQQFREGLGEAFGTLLEGWQKLYRHAEAGMQCLTSCHVARLDNNT